MEPEPSKPCCGQDEQIELSIVELRDAVGYVASDRSELRIWEAFGAIGLPAGAADADADFFIRVWHGYAFAQDDHVARVFMPGQPEEVDAVAQSFGEVLGAVDCQVYASFDECVVDVLGEEVGCALAQVALSVAVSGRGECEEFEFQAESFAQSSERVFSLNQRQRAGPGPRL